MQFEIEFQLTGSAADVEITLSGVATVQEFRQFVETLTSDPHFRAGLTMLVDVATLDTSTLSDDGLQLIAGPIVERDWYQPPAAVAIVAPGEQVGSHARAYRAHLGGTKSNRQIFTSRAEAIAWLEQQDRYTNPD